MKPRVELTILCLLGIFFAGCASTADRPHSATADTRESGYLLEVTFEWGVGENPYRRIQTKVEVGKEFYVKVLDRDRNYHAIYGTLERGGDGDSHLALHYANWSAQGSAWGTIPMDLRVGGGWGGGSNAGGYGVRLLPCPNKLSVEPNDAANGSQPFGSDTNRTSPAAGSRR